MPRKTPLSERESGICRRVGEIRKAAGLSRVALAKLANVDSSRLANYEHGRSPVPFSIGERVARAGNVNQRFLARGRPPIHPYMPLDPVLEEEIPKGMLFSAVFDRLLQELIDERFMLLNELNGKPPEDLPRWIGYLDLPPLGSSKNLISRKIAEHLGSEKIRVYMRSLPASDWDDFIAELAATGDRFWVKRGRSIDAFLNRDSLRSLTLEHRKAVRARVQSRLK